MSIEQSPQPTTWRESLRDGVFQDDFMLDELADDLFYEAVEWATIAVQFGGMTADEADAYIAWAEAYYLGSHRNTTLFEE